MIELQNDELQISFPELHRRADCSIHFQRTLRIPDDNRSYPLPAGLGEFPLHHVDDFADKVPANWRQHGGVMLPMYQSEALWISFNAGYPCAVKVAAGKINAITGEPWSEGLSATKQDYVVIPEQPWLDGFCVQEGLIRQFVAMPLGSGFTAEEQLTGKAEHGGLQLVVYPMRRKHYESLRKVEDHGMRLEAAYCRSEPSPDYEMGLAPGGLMRQEIAEDPYGVEAWDTSVRARCFVHILNTTSYRAITGCRPPTEPMTAQHYQAANIPWFDYYAGDVKALQGAPKLSALDSVATKTLKQGKMVNEPVVVIDGDQVVKLGAGKSVREGSF